MGPTALLPLWRKACWGFFCPKNPTYSAWFEPVPKASTLPLDHRSRLDPVMVLKDLTPLHPLNWRHCISLKCQDMLSYPPHSVASQKTRVFTFGSSWNLPNDCIIKVWLSTDNHCQEFELCNLELKILSLLHITALLLLTCLYTFQLAELLCCQDFIIQMLTHWGQGHLNCLNTRSRGF